MLRLLVTLALATGTLSSGSASTPPRSARSDQMLNTALIRAVRERNVVLIRALLQKGADPNTTAGLSAGNSQARAHTEPALAVAFGPEQEFQCCPRQRRSEPVAVIRTLLERGADPNTKDSLGTPVLCLAANYGWEECVRLLLRHGASVQSRDAYGNTALIHAMQCANAGIVKQLIAAGADVNAEGFQRLTPLVSAQFYNEPHVATLLVAAGARH